MNREEYLHSLQSLLPQGQAWTREPNANLTKVLGFVAGELARVEVRAWRLIDEADPRYISEMLTDWETALGLPDLCSQLATTLQERIAAVVDKFLRSGGQTIAYFQGIAERLGYEVTIDEYRPFICGVSECGFDELNGPDLVRHQWRVTVHGPRIIEFICGISECGDPLGDIRRAEDLECILNMLKPAHTHLFFAYEGA